MRDLKQVDFSQLSNETSSDYDEELKRKRERERKYEELKKQAKQEAEREEAEKKAQSPYEQLKRQAKQEAMAADSAKVDSAYINSFLNDASNFLTSSKSSLDNTSWASAMDIGARERREASSRDLSYRADLISYYLDHNGAGMDKSTAEELRSYLDAYRTDAFNLSEAHKSYNQFYSQWATEDDYNTSVRTGGYSKKYDGMTSDEIDQVLGTLDDGEEKEWLTAHRSSVRYDEMLKYDTESATKQVNDLKDILDQMEAIKGRIQIAQNMPTYTPGYSSNKSVIAGYEAELAKLEQKYGSYESIKAQYNQKSAYLSNAKRIQEGVELASVADGNSENYDPGFAFESKYTPNDDWYDSLEFSDVLYDEANGVKRATPVTKSWADKITAAKQMTEEELAIFNYWYNNEGWDKAEKYLDSIMDELNLRVAKNRFADMKGNTALELLFSLEAGYDQFLSGAQNLFNTEDSYIPVSSTQVLSGMVRKDLGDNGPKLPEWLGGSSLGQVGYDFVTTSANMAPSILTSAALSMVNPTLGAVAGNTLMGASAAGNAYAEKINLGYSKDEARSYGLMVGASEATLQYLLGGIGKLGGNGLSKVAINKLDKVDNILARVAKSTGGKIFLNGVSEGFEEGLQAILEPYLWQAVSGEEGSVNWEETLYSSLLGFVTGGVFESPGAIVQSAGQNIGYYKTGADIRNAGGTDALMALANEVAGVAPANMQNAIQKQSSKVDKKATSRRVGKLYDTVQNATSQADISQSLQTKGFSKETANDIAAAVIASNNGRDLSSAQRKLLKLVEKNSVAREAIASAMSSPQSSVGQKLRVFQSGVARGNVAEAASAQLGKGGNITEGNLTTAAETAAEGRYGANSTANTETVRIDTGEKVKIAGVATKDGKAISYRLDNGETATGQDLALSESDAILASTLGEMNIGAEDANSIWQASDGSSAFAAGVRLAYEYGYQGQEYGKIDAKAFGEGFPEEVKKLAYNLGRKAIALENAGSYNKNITTKEGARNGAGESVHLRQGAQRLDGADTGRQVRGVEEAPGRVQKRKAAGKSESNGRSAAETEGRVNAKDLGVPGGIGARKLTRVDGSYSADTKQAIAEATQNGLNVVCFTGGNLEVEGIGQARAAICGNDVFIRADHPEFTAMQLLHHEMAHREFGHAGEDLSGKVDVRKVYDRLVELCGSEEAVKNVIAMYSEAFDMGYDAETGADALAMEVFTEIVCDSQADMNAFAPEDQADMAGFMREIKRIAQEEKAQIQGRAPPDVAKVSFSRNGYWVPNLTKQERSRVEYLINNNNGTQLTSNCNVFFDKSKGNILFGIYSTDDNTLLYASTGSKANNEHLFTKMVMEEYENERGINGRAEDAHTFVERLRMQQTASSVNGSGIGVSRGYAENGRVHGVPSGRNTSRALRSVLANLFSAETERTADRTVKLSREATDKVYLNAVESGDIKTAQKLVDQAAKRWGAYLNNAEANEVFSQSGEVRTFYHGTNTGDFTVFDKSLLGSSSGDLGWFGKGFYFAFSSDEASMYGGRVIPAYLKMKNPFDYSQLFKYKHSEYVSDRYSRFAWVYNIVEQFPDIVNEQTVYAYPNDATEGTPVTWKQLSEMMDKIQSETEFSVERVESSNGDTAWELRADPKQESFTSNDGETITWTEYGMRERFAKERDAMEPINQIGAYLSNVIGIESIPRKSIERIDFSGAVQRAGHDGIIQSRYGDEAVVFNAEQIKSADPVTYDDNGKVIPLSKRFDNNKNDIRFSRESVVEQVGSLVALHNLTERKLNKVLDLGGFPMPSIAVTRTDIPHTNFGDITLVMDKSAIDPRANRKNTVYSADAWTPTVPRLSYKPSESKLREIKKKVNGLVGSREVIAALDHVALDEDNISRDLERYDGDLVDSYRRNNTLQYAFLKDIGEEIELPMKEETLDGFGKFSNATVQRFAGRLVHGLQSVDYYQNMGAQQLVEDEDLKNVIADILNEEVLADFDPKSEHYRQLLEHPLHTADEIDFSHIDSMLSAARRYFTYGVRQTIDRRKAGQVVRNYIEKNGLQERYEQWLRELYDGVVEKTGIYNNKAHFTPSGNRRSWEQLHLPATLDNIVKAMATQNGGNTKNVAGFNGVKTLRAGMAKRFKSIADMHKLEGRLQNLTEEEFEEIHDQLSERMYDIISRIIDTGPKSSENRFIRMDSVGATLMEIAESGKYSADAIQHAVNQYSYHIGESLAEDIRDLLYDVSQMPANMFEAKPERSVGFDEVRAAVLPDNSSQKLRDSLAAKGIEVLVYEAGNDADRLVKLNSLLEKKTELRFSREFVSKQMSEQEKLLEKANKALEKSNAQLQEDNQYLKQMLKLQRQVTGGTKFTKSSVEAAARQLMKTSDAKGNAKELAELLNEFYEYVATGRELTWEDVMAKAQPAVDWLNKNRNRSFVREAYAQEILDEMRGRSFYLDESQRAEAAHAYGSYQAFRQKMWGTVTVSDKANMSLDEFWKEISEKHPFYFPEGTTSGDQVRGIVDALERLKTAEETNSELLDGYSEEMHERELLHEVYDSFWRVSTLRTVADVKQRQINALKSKHYAAMDKIRSEHKKAMTDLAIDYGKRMKELRKAYRERTEDKAAKVKGRNAVEKQAKLLMNMLAHPTKDAHVPSDLQKPLEDFLHSIDFSSKQLNRGGEATIRDIAYTRALAAVRTAIAGQRNAIEGVTDGVFKLDIPDSFLEEIDKHNQAIIDATNGLDLTTNRVYDMSSDELADLGHILTVINKAIRDIDKLHMEGAKARVSDLAMDTQKEMRQRERVKGEKGNAAMWASYTPWHAFRRMGSAAQQIFHGLMQGQAKLARTADSVIKFSKKTFTEKEVKSWEKDVHTINLQSGESVKMSTAQIMGFYCLSKREQGDSHMMGGGIRIGAIKPGKSKDIVQKDHYVLSIQDIAAINSKLTDRQRQVAEDLQKYMETTGGRLINEISMARWGYAAASEIGYYPIKTDDATRDAKDPGQDKTNLWALLNKSFTKAPDPRAKNAMIVDSIFDVFADHMSQVAEYNAFALPLVDAMKWFNYRERINMDDGHIKDVGVQRAIRDTLGTSAVKYFTDLMTDINSSQKAGRHENFAGKLLSRAKVSSVGFNLRVAIQQPTAILRASLILDAPELVKGAVRIGTRKLVKEMQQYSGIALWKSMGYYDLNISRGLQEQIKGDESFLDKANEVGMWLPGKMDEWTWARIWAACKAKASKDTKLTGEALSVETAKLFEDVVYQTQVADSVLTRSSLMRSKSQFMKEATSFMAEPTVSLNILLSAFQDYQKGHTTWQKAKRGLMIGFCGYALPAVTNAIFTAFADAWRDDDEYEDFLDKFNQALFGDKKFLDGNLFSELNPLEKIPFIRDAISMLKGYSVAPGYADMIQSGIDLVDAYKKFLSGKGSKTEYGILYQTLQVLGSAVGIGAAPALREVAGIWNHTVGAMYPEYKLKRWETNPKTEIRDAYNRGYFTSEEAMAELLIAGIAGDENEAFWLVREWDYAKENGSAEGYSKYGEYYAAVAGNDRATASMLYDKLIAEKVAEGYLRSEAKDSIASSFTTQVKKEYMDGEISRSKAIDLLTANTDNGEAEVKKWDFELEYGFSWSTRVRGYRLGKISESELISAVMDIEGESREEAEEYIRFLDLEMANQDISITASEASSYFEHAEPAGIAIDVYLDYKNKAKDITGEGKKKRRMDVIHSLPLTNAQKDALYYAEGWSASTIHEAPWH